MDYSPYFNHTAYFPIEYSTSGDIEAIYFESVPTRFNEIFKPFLKSVLKESDKVAYVPPNLQIQKSATSCEVMAIKTFEGVIEETAKDLSDSTNSQRQQKSLFQLFEVVKKENEPFFVSKWPKKTEKYSQTTDCDKDNLVYKSELRAMKWALDTVVTKHLPK